MKIKFAAALLLAAPLLAGCLERGQPTMVESGGGDDGVAAISLPARQKLS